MKTESNNNDIILVDDNPEDVELVLRAFKKNHILNNFHVISDGEEALEYFFATGRYSHRHIDSIPKLVILDLKLPKVDGLEVLNRLKTDERTRSIPVVIMTSSQEESDVIKGYRSGANSFIVKPVDFDKFMTTIRDLGLYWLLLNIPPR
jgi:CheY-like chemotaxis protein